MVSDGVDFRKKDLYNANIYFPSNIVANWIFSKSNKLKFATDLANTNWSDIYNYQEANDAYNVFSTRICKLIENNFPLTKLSRAKHKDKKWITLGLRKSSRHKNKLYKNWIQTKSN